MRLPFLPIAEQCGEHVVYMMWWPLKDLPLDVIIVRSVAVFLRDDGPEICAVVVVAEARRTTPAAAHVVSIFSPLGLFRSL